MDRTFLKENTSEVSLDYFISISSQEILIIFCKVSKNNRYKGYPTLFFLIFIFFQVAVQSTDII